MQSDTPVVRDLLLIGGGHSHVQVLKHFAMQPVAGVRLTLVCDADVAPYSGMVPGYIAGHYALDEIQIALQPLCRAAGARFVCAEVTALDRHDKRVVFADRPSMSYDLLSINCGARPDLQGLPGVAVKPLGEFLAHWPSLQSKIEQSKTPASLTLVGAGAGGVEMALACRAGLPEQTVISLIGPRLLPGLSKRAETLTEQTLSSKCIDYLPERVTGALSTDSGFRLMLANGASKDTEHLLWVTDVRAPDWLAESGLSCDDKGFMHVSPTLCSVNDTSVFAAGDAAHLVGQQRAKAGVYAVRAAPVLTRNLSLAAQGLPLSERRSRFSAQRAFLTLIGTGDTVAPEAIATKGPFALKMPYFWRLKERIDRRFIERFQRLSQMQQPSRPNLAPALAADLPDDAMRCGGCGAKLAADPLRRVLARLPKQEAAHVTLGIGDDAAQVLHGTGSTFLSVDGFRAMIDDPYLLGRICAHHSLNDLFAMGAQPSAALALATIPLMAEAMMEEDLFQLLSGVVDVLNAHGAPLVGGHSAEGAELSIGLTVTGVPGARTLTKSMCRPGDALIVTKPLGTGVILAAAMRGLHEADAIPACLEAMNCSNAPALEILQGYGISALTDVTGFGLIGHLSEMLRASDCGVELRLDRVPMLPGARSFANQGVRSSIQSANALALGDFSVAPSVTDGAALALLSDPQTSGGLLACVASEQADACVSTLGDAGIPAANIGYITPKERRSII